MARAKRRRNREISSEPGVAVRQIDPKILRNRFAPLEALDEEQLEFIHNISLRIIEEQGIEVMSGQALVTRPLHQPRCLQTPDTLIPRSSI